MLLISVDYHPSFQQIASFVEETGECEDRRLNHNDGQAEPFYRDLKQSGICPGRHGSLRRKFPAQIPQYSGNRKLQIQVEG
jgi:hypothetical protein